MQHSLCRKYNSIKNKVKNVINICEHTDMIQSRHIKFEYICNDEESIFPVFSLCIKCSEELPNS